jgi:hypothetical protein
MTTEKTIKLASFIYARANEDSHAKDMAKAILDHILDWEYTKLHRWIGYAQCLLVTDGVMSLEEIIEQTRKVVKDNK